MPFATNKTDYPLMRVGIITFHHAYNYGAFLQAEGLYGHLRELGHEPEIVDYRHPGLEAMHERCIRYGLHPLRKLAGYRRRGMFIDAQASLDSSPRCNALEDVDWSKYDAVVYGSDEIWNFHSHVHGFEPAFFGGSTPDNLRRIAYAPSLGELEFESHALPSGLAALLARYHHIAVRDENAASLVQKAVGIRPVTVVDPVFLYNRPVVPAELRSSRPYMLVYGEVRGKEWISACLAYAKKHGCQTLSVGYRNPWCDKVILAAGPHDFLAWLSAAEQVLTTTFHGTMFSVKFQKPFLTLRPETSRKKFDPILRQLDLAERLLGSPTEMKSSLPAIDWPTVTDMLGKIVQKSSAYLRESLAP